MKVHTVPSSQRSTSSPGVFEFFSRVQRTSSSELSVPVCSFHSSVTYECECVRLSGVCLGAPAPVGHLHAVPHGANRVEGRTHIQDRELVRFLVDFSVVVVDDVAHLLPAAVHDPVVAVERQLVAEKEEEELNYKSTASSQRS